MLAICAPPPPRPPPPSPLLFKWGPCWLQQNIQSQQTAQCTMVYWGGGKTTDYVTL